MVALPALMAALPFSSARVWVGPPLLARVPRLISAEVFVVAQALVALEVAWVTMLFAGTVGSLPLPEEIRFTVPLPT